MPTLNLALCLGMIWPAPSVCHTLGFQIIRQLTRDIGRAVVALEARTVFSALLFFLIIVSSGD